MVQNSLDISLLVVKLLCECVCVCVCVCVHKAEHTAAETACFVFSSHSIIQALSSCFCFLSPNQQVAEGPVGNLYRYLDALDLLPEASLSLFLSENTQTLLYNYVSHQRLALHLKMDV